MNDKTILRLCLTVAALAGCAGQAAFSAPSDAAFGESLRSGGGLILAQAQADMARHKWKQVGGRWGCFNGYGQEGRNPMTLAQLASARGGDCVQVTDPSPWGADLRGASLRGAMFLKGVGGCDFSGSDLTGARISGIVGRVKFKDAILRGAIFSDIIPAEVDLSGADLRGATVTALVCGPMEVAGAVYDSSTDIGPCVTADQVAGMLKR